MPTCIICLDILKSPVALPCGHVFCQQCLQRVVMAIAPFMTQHQCPTCRAPYCIAGVDPSIVPEELRAHILPAVRKVYLDLSPNPHEQASAKKSPSLGGTEKHSDQQVPESLPPHLKEARLRLMCDAWRGRAQMHAAATLGLVGLARLARDHALKMQAERNQLQKRYLELKRQCEIMCVPLRRGEGGPLC
ncbi:hypothetical protein PUNSTDRAFT_77334 [Punctularia strigosozonata HHB-11173 SS5]|uniref:RING-type domain-containing protein n=1 Tax=Punctularia strigosozonata (strain HHB-11173) TaxID=741275 RepID=R7S0E0_PUNST|nr:uncharacterized protein PUNSTDRAFT_77334 [Punctularia strigosozonata HHB-11173 SS5]EIN03855.1 hypothetical protein PUNSTDRAFT_77334 [Punctularia strigosozonata HHB-11173 SS5]